jgi:indolepyruvate ferredoxin oxidoreductase beta subunit
MDSPRARRTLARFTAGRRISTSTISGFLMLRFMSALRRFRRGTLRFKVENERIEAWLGQIASIAPRDYDLAVELAECQTLVKGYGDTHERGWSSFSQISELVPKLVGEPQSAARLRGLREAALSDDNGEQLKHAISQLAA